MIKKLFETNEMFVWACLQFPLVFLIGYWVIPAMILAGIFGRLGGMENSSKLFRRIGVPLVPCLATFLIYKQWSIFLAIPFMIWGCPFSYGEDSWLFKKIKALVKDQKKADILVRGLGYIWYWVMFSIFLIVGAIYGR